MFELMIVFNHTQSCLTGRSTSWPLFTSRNFWEALYAQSVRLLEDLSGQFLHFPLSSNTATWTERAVKRSCLTGPIRKGKLTGGKCRSCLKHMFDCENCSPDLRRLMTYGKVTVCIFVQILKGTKTKKSFAKFSGVMFVRFDLMASRNFKSY